MKEIWKKFKWVISGIVIIGLLILAIVLKDSKIAELITKLRMSRVDSEEERIDIAIEDAIQQGEIEKDKINDMDLQERSDWYNERYKNEKENN